MESGKIREVPKKWKVEIYGKGEKRQVNKTWEMEIYGKGERKEIKCKNGKWEKMRDEQKMGNVKKKLGNEKKMREEQKNEKWKRKWELYCKYMAMGKKRVFTKIEK